MAKVVYSPLAFDDLERPTDFLLKKDAALAIATITGTSGKSDSD